MCGIYCSVSCSGLKSVPIEKNVEQLLQRRGPDASRMDMLLAPNAAFCGYVLWQQGAVVCPQPLVSDNLAMLLNGDIFNVEHLKSEELSDTVWLVAHLEKSCGTEEELCSIFRTLRGPYSMIFFNRKTQDLYFGRDSLGRNSLLIERIDDQLRFLSTSYFSGAQKKCLTELPPLGLFRLNIVKPNVCTLFPWSQRLDEESTSQLELIEKTIGMTITVAAPIEPSWLAVQCTAKESFDLYKICDSPALRQETFFEEILIRPEVAKELQQFSKLLESSVKDRVQKTPRYCGNCISQRHEFCNHSKIAIFFSGGIDCSILAVLADKFIHPEDTIDLINVAFEKVNSQQKVDWDVPDRISSRDSLNELKRICPRRTWNFVEVNVTRAELQSILQNHIQHLIYPLNTVLDESIGCAFWFAARGEGDCGGEPYKSPARVVIIGSGADELFGGYTRHRNAYLRCKGSALEKRNSVHIELEKDWRRIPARNLARDDRVIADHGKTSRAPFIEENLVQYVRGLHPNQRCCYLLDEGIGDKLFLRLYGYKLGFRSAVSLRKRAIQFGSRIANKKQNAAYKSDYLNFEGNK